MFDRVDDPVWNGEATTTPLRVQDSPVLPLRKLRSPAERLI